MRSSFLRRTCGLFSVTKNKATTERLSLVTTIVGGSGSGGWSNSHHTSSAAAAQYSSSSSSTTPSPSVPSSTSVKHRDNDSKADDDNMSQNEKECTPYERWIRRLYQTNLFHPVKFGLTNIQQLHEALGHPMDNPNLPIIHIAGTNGKGSVALKIANTLRCSNPSLRVGLFTSPHIATFRERIQLHNQTLIPESAVSLHLSRLYRVCEQQRIPATFFELTTALAFAWFSGGGEDGGGGADVVVLETGLGGRLDATNVVSQPALTIITSIGLEHTKILGDTVEAIAKEKGGIMKEDCPVLVGPNVPHETLRECAKEHKASQYRTCEDVLGEISKNGSSNNYDGDDDGLVDYDQENSRIAKAAIVMLQKSHPHLFVDTSPETISKGLSVRPPCRFEIVEVEGDDNDGTVGAGDPLTVVLDVAHNPPALEYLFRKLRTTYPQHHRGGKLRVVVGLSSDKDLSLCGTILFRHVLGGAASLHLVRAQHPRAATIEEMVAAEPRLRDSHYDGNTDGTHGVTRQLRAAIRLAKANQEVVVVCGSVFLMAEAREVLGFQEPRDSELIASVVGANNKHGQEVFGNTDPEPKQATNGAG